MFIVFKGYGWLVPITAIGSMVLAGLCGFRDPLIIWPVMAASGIADNYLGKKWNDKEVKLLQDLGTGEVHEVKEEHSLFWIPMQYWLWVKLCIAGLFITIALSVKP